MGSKASRRRGGDSPKRTSSRTTGADGTSASSGARKAGTARTTRSRAASAEASTSKTTAKKSTASKSTARKSTSQAAEVKTGPESITSYPNAVRWVLELHDVERQRVVQYDPEGDFKLDRMRSLLTALGNPQEQFRSVHIAGTNGKGSTGAMISAMLRRCGLAIGSYTSPHLMDIRERISINGQNIGRTEFTELMKKVAEASVSIG